MNYLLKYSLRVFNIIHVFSIVWPNYTKHHPLINILWKFFITIIFFLYIQNKLNKIERDTFNKKQGAHGYARSIHRIDLGLFMSLLYRHAYFFLKVDLIPCHSNKHLKEVWFLHTHKQKVRRKLLNLGRWHVMTCYCDKKRCVGFNTSHRDFVQAILCDVTRDKQTLHVPPDVNNF